MIVLSVANSRNQASLFTMRIEEETMAFRFRFVLLLVVLLLAAHMVSGHAAAVPVFHVTLTGLQVSCDGSPSSAYWVENLSDYAADTVHDIVDSTGVTAYSFLGQLRPHGTSVFSLADMPLACGTYTVEIYATQPAQAGIVVAYTFDGLLALVGNLPPDSLVPQLANSLMQKVRNAEVLSVDNPDEAASLLGAFINQVRAQSGKGIAAEAASRLINYATQVIAQL